MHLSNFPFLLGGHFPWLLQWKCICFSAPWVGYYQDTLAGMAMFNDCFCLSFYGSLPYIFNQPSSAHNLYLRLLAPQWPNLWRFHFRCMVFFTWNEVGVFGNSSIELNWLKRFKGHLRWEMRKSPGCHKGFRCSFTLSSHSRRQMAAVNWAKRLWVAGYDV